MTRPRANNNTPTRIVEPVYNEFVSFAAGIHAAFSFKQFNCAHNEVVTHKFDEFEGHRRVHGEIIRLNFGSRPIGYVPGDLEALSTVGREAVVYWVCATSHVGPGRELSNRVYR